MAGRTIAPFLDYLRRLHHVGDADQRNDAELLRAFVANNDRDAIAAVVARHASLVWGVCRRILGHEQDAEDAFQATFLILARHAGSRRWHSSVGGWLHTVAQRLAVRAKKRREQQRLREQATERTPTAESSLTDLAAVVDEELRHLPEKYRTPLLLHYLEGMTAEAAARQLGLSRTTFYNRLASGRELLRDRLSRQGLSLAAPLLVASLTQEAKAIAPSLIQTAMRAALGHASERVATLAAEALGATAAMKVKIGLTLGLLLGMAAGGVAMLMPRTPAAPIFQAERPIESPKAEDKAAGRVDRHGDPLPEGVIARLGTLRFRVEGEIAGLAFAPDGKTLAVGSHQGVWLLDAVGGKRLRRLDTSPAVTRRLAFSADGKRLIGTSVAWDKGVPRRVMRVWQTASGRQLLECQEAAGARWLGWSASGQPLAFYTGNGEMRLRDVATGRERAFSAKDLADPMRSAGAVCAGNSTLLAAADEKGVVHVWEAANGQERCALQSGRVRGLALSSTGRWLAALSKNADNKESVQLWDLTTSKIHREIAADQPSNFSAWFKIRPFRVARADAERPAQRGWQGRESLCFGQD